MAGSQDELRGIGAGGLYEQYVAAGAIEKDIEDFGRDVGTVLAEDALVGDAPGDLHSGFARDVMEDLIEAGVVRDDGQLAAAVGDLSAVWWLLPGGLRGRECGERDADDKDESDFRGMPHGIDVRRAAAA